MKKRLADKWFLLRLYPELNLFDTEEQQVKAWKRARRRPGGLWICAYVLLSMLVLPPVNSEIMRLAFRLGIPPVYGKAARVVVGTLGGAFMMLVGFWSVRRRVQIALREELVQSRHPVCIRCGYELRGQQDPRCPECGTPFDESLLRKLYGPKGE